MTALSPRRSRRLIPGRRRRIVTPTVLQMEAVECGAAALGIVLGAFGRHVPLEELRRACGVSRDGSKASNILRAGREYGLVCRGFRKEPEGLAHLPLPAIVFWNFNHFVVVEGYGGGKVYLNDPAMGPRIVSEADFDQGFTGVVLTFERGPDFRPGGRRPGLGGKLLARLNRVKTALLFACLASLMLVVPGLLYPAFLRVFIDNVLVAGQQNWFRPLLVAMGLTAIVQAVLIFLQQQCLLRMQTKLAVTSSADFFWHVLRLPIDFFNQRQGAEIGARVAINDRVAQTLSGELAVNGMNILLIGFYAVVMAQYDLLLTAMGVFLAMTNFLYLLYVSRQRRDVNARLQRDQGKLAGVAMNGLSMIETLKAQGAESDFFAKWAGCQARAINAEQTLGRTTQALNHVPLLLSGLSVVVILGVGGLRVMAGDLTMGELVAFQSLMASFLNPVTQLVALGASIQQMDADMGRLDDVLQSPALADAPDGAPDGDAGPSRLSGRLDLRGLTFGYSPLEPPLIENFDLSLQPGDRVALVGGSGSGKSTIARLITGLYEPWSGDILFDGRVAADIPRQRLCDSLALVDQDIFLFDGTITDNLTLWDDTVPAEQVTRAARDACIHDDIAARPGGYGGAVEEGGRNFSGGQRQRLEIARALTGQPTLLVMDEATSALDPVTEQTVDRNLRRRGVTCVIVAHRLSAIRDCDEIIVLDRGKVAQRGTHDALLAQGGLYADLIRIDG